MWEKKNTTQTNKDKIYVYSSLKCDNKFLLVNECENKYCKTGYFGGNYNSSNYRLQQEEGSLEPLVHRIPLTVTTDRK